MEDEHIITTNVNKYLEEKNDSSNMKLDTGSKSLDSEEIKKQAQINGVLEKKHVNDLEKFGDHINNSKSGVQLIEGLIEEQNVEIVISEEKDQKEKEELYKGVSQGQNGEDQEEEAREQEKEDKEEDEIQQEIKPEEREVTNEIIGKKEVKHTEESLPDPAAPLNFSDSKEALKPRFELRPDQLSEIEQLWELYQNYTPAYTDISGYITEKELVYMLKALFLMTYTPEQLQELIAFSVRPPHPQGHINFDQFLKIVTIRQREFSVEEELRTALQVLDPDKTGLINREYMKDVLSKLGYKMPTKQLHNLMKEVDISNDGTIAIEDVVGTLCIDLSKEDFLKLREL